MENQNEFWQFSDQLRLHSGGFANLALNDTTWAPKRFEDRRNFEYFSPSSSSGSAAAPEHRASDFNPFDDGWKNHLGLSGGAFSKKEPPSPLPVASSPVDKNLSAVNRFFANEKDHDLLFGGGNKNVGKYANNFKHGVFGVKKKESNDDLDAKNANNYNNGGVEKRFKTVPASEALPRNEAIGGYVFVCKHDTMQENLRR